MTPAPVTVLFYKPKILCPMWHPNDILSRFKSHRKKMLRLFKVDDVYVFCLPHFLRRWISCRDVSRESPCQCPLGGSRTRNSFLERSTCRAWTWCAFRSPCPRTGVGGCALRRGGVCCRPGEHGSRSQEWCEDPQMCLKLEWNKLASSSLYFFSQKRNYSQRRKTYLPITGSSYFSNPTTQYWHGMSLISLPFTEILLEEDSIPGLSS